MKMHLTSAGIVECLFTILFFPYIVFLVLKWCKETERGNVKANFND